MAKKKKPAVTAKTALEKWQVKLAIATAVIAIVGFLIDLPKKIADAAAVLKNENSTQQAFPDSTLQARNRDAILTKLRPVKRKFEQVVKR